MKQYLDVLLNYRYIVYISALPPGMCAANNASLESAKYTLFFAEHHDDQYMILFDMVKQRQDNCHVNPHMVQWTDIQIH